jgi:flagellar basal-body rod modification protein FlgD
MIPPALAAAAATTAIGALSSIASAATGSSGSTTPISSDTATGTDNATIGQPQFLQLLVAQLQNQDPLNPMDSANFSAQLAQFSSLEQLTEINSKISALGQTPAPTQSFDPVGLLGRQVTATSSTVDVKSGSASALDYTLANAGNVSIEVHDAAGNLISSAQLGQLAAGEHILDLHDVPAFANLADGTYDVKINVQTPDGAKTAVDTRVNGTVTSVDLKSNPPVIKIGDIEIPLGDVRDVSAAAAA